MGKNKGTTKKKKLTRRATFVRGKHLEVDKTGGPARSLNAVKRAALNADAPPMRAALVDDKPTVFFKPHDADDGASQYAVASTRLARFLKMDEVIAHNAFGKVHNVRGAVSGAVPGSPLFSVERNKEVHRPPEYSKAETPNWVRDKQLDERDGKFYDVSKKIYQWVDFTDPRIQKGMSDLQLFDAITGQVDRHAGNIFVDPNTGEVSGIDDDKSFGNGMAVNRQADVSFFGGYYRGLPPLVDEDTAQRILDADPTQLPEILSAADTDSVPLSDKDIADAVRRFEGVRQYVRDLQKAGALVGQNNTTWNNATYQQAMADSAHSYLGYQAASLEDAIQRSAAGDPMYEVVGAPPPAPAPPPVPVGLNLAQILQGQQAPPGNVPAINQPPATVVLPPAQRGPDTPPAQGVVRAAQSRLDATRPRLWIGARPTRRGVSELDTADSDTTSSQEDGNPPSDSAF